MVDDRAKLLAKFIEPLRVEPGSKVKLPRDFDPGYKASFLKKKEGAGILAAGVTVLEEYQARLAAQDTWGVLACLQALDAGGKDGTIRHVLSGVNPQGVRVTGFKVPSARGTRPRLPVALRAGGYRPGARSASSTGRITRRSWSCGSTPRTAGPAAAPRDVAKAKGCGSAGTRRSTTGSITWPTTGSRSSSCS